MTVYTVHEPPARARDPDDNADRIVFVRDGFHFWAFLLAPLWMLWHRLWLVLFIFVVATTALQAGLWALGLSAAATFTVGALISLLIGFEAATLRRWTYGRRRFADLGVVVGPDRDAAERRFFDSRAARPDASSLSHQRTTIHMPASSPEVIGLFPEPELRR